MAKSLSDWLTYMMTGSRPNHTVTTTTKDIDPMYNAVAPFALGSADTEKIYADTAKIFIQNGK